MAPIISLTDAALNHIKTLLNDAPDALGFRLSIKKTGCSGFAYVPELMQRVIEEDMHFMTENHIPIYIDKTAIDFVKGLIIDYQVIADGSLKQKKLIYINPNEKNRCGCGESFTVE